MENHHKQLRSVLKYIFHGFPGGSDGKGSTCNVGNLGSVLGLGRSPGEGNGNPLQDFCPESSMDRGALQGPWGCKELRQLSN